MNFVEISKMIMNGEKLYNLPLRVCFYARVSTDNDVQLNSLENQLNYYQDYIKSKSLWTYVDGYVDEGISGVRVENRNAFKKMIEDAKMGLFDLIITKEVSRFARDLEDSIHYIRILKEANVGIYFENQNLNTFDYNSELILNIMFNLAQDESRKLSFRVKFGHREAIRKGHVLGSSNIIGYQKNKCKLVVDEEEAKFVRKVFELYASGDCGFYKLSKQLGELGFYNKNGNLYDKDTLKRILQNPKYKGFYRGKTTEVVDYRTKKRVKVSEENQVIYKSDDSIIPAIVSEELWDCVNQILKTRKKSFFSTPSFSGGLKYPFSSKIYCKEHNVNFQRSHGSKKKDRPTWSCGLYLQLGLDSCSSPILAEEDLYFIMKNIMCKIIPSKEKVMKDMIDLYSNTTHSNSYCKELENIDKNIKLIEKKKMMAFDFLASEELRKEELKGLFQQFEKELENFNQKRKKIVDQMEIFQRNYQSSKSIFQSIQEEIDGGILEEFIRKFVDEIIVSKIGNDRHFLRMDIYLNLSGNGKRKIKGARHIDGSFPDDMLFCQDIEWDSVEVVRKNRKINHFVYNVYFCL